MKLISYEQGGRARFGAVKNSGVVDLSQAFEGRAADLRALLALGALDEAERYVATAEPSAPLASIRFLPVIPNPDKIFMVAVNYDDHRIEAGRDRTEHPVLFLRLPQSQLGHDQPILVPTVSDKLDYEGEIAVVIGRGGRHIPRGAALAHVAGFSAYNDASVRDWQRHTHQFTPGKNFDATGAFGPWLVTLDEVGDYKGMTLQTRVNGVVLQEAGARDLIFDVEDLIAYISDFTSLLPGDVIVTGTCGGVGFKRAPPIYLKPGDIVEVEVSSVGVLANPVAAEAAVRPRELADT